MTAAYDSLGTTYRVTRRADPRIVEKICGLLALPAGARILDVGAGTGNYARALAERGYLVTALEPSKVMMEQAGADVGIHWIQGSAEEMPFADGQFDAAILILSVHHFSDRSRAFQEIRRVTGAGAVVVFTYDPAVVDTPWLFRYFPSFRKDIEQGFPPVRELASHLVAHGDVSFHDFHLPPDLADGFAGAAWRTPERYLDQGFRDGTSAFRQLPVELCDQGVHRLRTDLASGAWDAEFGPIRSLESYHHGYTFVVTNGMNQARRPAAPSVIRRATADDASAIEVLYRELVSDPHIHVLPEQVTTLSDSQTSFLLVAEADGAVCATVLLTICPDAMYAAQPFGVVENVVVTRAMRGRGFGRLLLAHVEHLAGTHHCTKLMLLSSTTREAAHTFFRNCGFTNDTKHAFVKYRRQFAAP